MRRRLFVVSLAEFEHLLRSQKQVLERMGVDIKGLIAYSLYFAAQSFYPSDVSDRRGMYSHLLKDLREIQPDIDPILIHTCIDFVGQAAAEIVPFLTPILGGYDHTVRLDRFLGNDAVLSMDIPDTTL